MSSRHLVRRAADALPQTPSGGWASAARDYREWTVVGEDDGAVHTGFAVCTLGPGGAVPAHVHSFEESVYVVDGTGVLDMPDGSFLLGSGDYALLPTGIPHALRNVSDAGATWAAMRGPVPRARFGFDTFAVPPVAEREPVPIDVRDPRTRRFGTITPDHMDAAKQGQDMLAVSASMRTALLVYSGITVKMMVDGDLGARLTTMFMVQYAQDGVAGAHDHPFEETYMFLAGTASAVFDGESYVLGPGDVAWAGVGCVHGFANVGDGPLRWLETQAPQPPGRHSYRFARDWEYLRNTLGGEHG